MLLRLRQRNYFFLLCDRSGNMKARTECSIGQSINAPARRCFAQLKRDPRVTAAWTLPALSRRRGLLGPEAKRQKQGRHLASVGTDDGRGDTCARKTRRGKSALTTHTCPRRVCHVLIARANAFRGCLLNHIWKLGERRSGRVHSQNEPTFMCAD
jgi:hypothetical protein